jgi:cytochrome c biogenesis protein CcmG, thiol:disulfide interchange protein DsbE
MTDDLAPVRKGRTALVSASIVGVVMIAFIGLLATRDTGEREARSALIDRPAPAVVGETLDGAVFDLDELRGRWVLVNFFATWCPPCIVEHPELVAFHEAHAEAGDVEILSVAFQDSAAEIEAFFAEYGGEWPVLPEGLSGAAVSWGVAALPESFLVSPQGVVVHKFTGGVTHQALESVLAQARGLPPGGAIEPAADDTGGEIPS